MLGLIEAVEQDCLSGSNRNMVSYFLAAGIISGGLIALAVFSISVISVPMLIDRRVDVPEAAANLVSAKRADTGTNPP